MGIFKNLFKGDENKKYWEENKSELDAIIAKGEAFLEQYNNAQAIVNFTKVPQELIENMAQCENILNWFDDLKRRSCPYKLNEDTNILLNNLKDNYNTNIISWVKTSVEDTIKFRDLLKKDANNYESSLSELALQASNLPFVGYAHSWIEIVKQLFNNDESMLFLDIYVKCGMPKEVAFSKDSELINKWLPTFDENQKDEFTAYQLAISARYDLQTEKLPLYDINEHYGLNLKNDEKIFHTISADLFEEKVVSRNIAYAGLRWSNGLLRAGTLSPLISQEIKNFVIQDAGRIFITNKRIIFTGFQRNVTIAISLNNIIDYFTYKDGILICQPNKKAILFKFERGYNIQLSFVDDGICQFIIVLDRVLSNTAEG